LPQHLVDLVERSKCILWPSEVSDSGQAEPDFGFARLIYVRHQADRGIDHMLEMDQLLLTEQLGKLNNVLAQPLHRDGLGVEGFSDA
jgi:hypothetical protein